MWEDFESRYTGEEIESMLERAETKQDVIADLDEIRSNAQKGATAVQSSELAAVATSGSYDDLSDKPTIPDGTIIGVSVNGDMVSRGGVADIPSATTNRYGVTKLTSATDSTSETLAATAKAVKSAHDIANSKYTKPSNGIPKSDLSTAVQLEWTTLSDRINAEGVRITEVQNELKGAVKSVSVGVTLGEATAGEFFNVAKDSNGNVQIQMKQNTLASGKVAIPYTTDVKQYVDDALSGKQDVIEGLEGLDEKLAVLNGVVDDEGYLVSNGERVDMRFTRSLLPVGTSIPANANLNTITYLKIGKYYCSLNADAKTITNCPTLEAFSMEVFNPLGTNVDDETTRDYTYRLRVLTAYKTGTQYIQYCATSGTAGNWTYNGWYVVPRTSFALNSNKKGGTAVKGGTTRGVYIDSTGTFQQMSYTIAKSVPSNAVFTDTNTKVTAVGNHYTPVENADSALNAPDGEVLVGLKRDAAGHIVDVVSAPQGGGGGLPDLADVATSGSYNDLKDKPTIPSAVTESTVSGWGFTKNAGTYSKPSTGIPFGDFEEQVQGSIIKAEESVQSVSIGVTIGNATAGNFFNVNKDANGNVSIQMIQNSLASGKIAIPYTTDVKQYIDQAIANAGGGGGGATQSEIIEVAVDGGYAEIDNIADNTIYHVVGGSVNELYLYYFKDNLYRGTTIRFKSGADTIFEIFDNVLWANGVTPTIEDNTWYELSLTTSMNIGGSASYMLAVLTPFKLV